MAKSGIIILIIISLTGLGLGGYTFIRTLAPPLVVENQRLILVGVWDALDDNLDFTPHDFTNNWLLEYGDNKIYNSKYISISNTNTRITLVKSGWYRLHLSIVLGSIDTSSTYWMELLKNGALEFSMDRHQTSADLESTFHVIDSSVFVYSNGADYFEFNGISNPDTAFSPGINSYNQMTIEYVV